MGRRPRKSLKRRVPLALKLAKKIKAEKRKGKTINVLEFEDPTTVRFTRGRWIPECKAKKDKKMEKLGAIRRARVKWYTEMNERSREAHRIRGLKYQEEYDRVAADLVDERRKARQDGNFYKEPDAKLLCVVRIRGVRNSSPKTRVILRLLRLSSLYSCTFVKVNNCTLKMLRMVHPYVAWGPPSLKTVRTLIYKRGYAGVKLRPYKVSRIPIMSNGLLAKHLGKLNVYCIEDLVHEIITAGAHFKHCNRFLWPFKLKPARFGISLTNKKKTQAFVAGGVVGSQGAHINRMIQSMC